MPTFVKRVENNRVLIQVAAAVEADGSELDHRFVALVDTGATITAVTPRLAAQIGVAPVGRRSFIPASGQPVETNLFGLHLAIPVETPTGEGDVHTFASGGPLVVMELPYQPPNYDVLLGMDVLANLHITMHGGAFIMSN